MKSFFRRLIVTLLAGCLLTGTAFAGNTKLTLTFTGDVTLGGEDRLMDAWDSFYTAAREKGYDYFLSEWKDMFDNDDLTVINLEGPLTDSTAMKANKHGVYWFRAPREYVKVLTGSGVDVCSICNNHTYDYGIQGYEATKETLRDAGVGYFGYEDYYLFEKDGIKIAFFAVQLGWLSLNRPQFLAKMDEARANGANAVVMVLHAGQEYKEKHIKDQGTFSRNAIDKMGADLVIMHHPHIPQGIAIMSSRYICYSLGNFCFGGNTNLKNDSLKTIVVQADMYFDETDHTYQGTQLRLYPAHTSSSEEKNDFHPIRITDPAEAETILDMVRRDTKSTIPIMYDEEQGCAVLAYVAADEGIN